jgi:adenylate cyclase
LKDGGRRLLHGACISQLMAADVELDLKLEIAHILTIDVVAYSTLLISEQSQLMKELIQCVRATPRFRQAEAEGKLIRIPTGDGMALVFFNDPEAPIECAVQIGTELKSHPEIRLRMGIHSGPINQVADVNDRSNVAGAGIDMAQRVMDCGDAGHILLSRRVADDLASYSRWNRHLHNLGDCEVKHGRKISLVNFYTGEIGNPAVPAKLQRALDSTNSLVRRRRKKNLLLLLAVGLALTAITSFLILPRAGARNLDKSIAVLPFDNFSDDKENAHFADGVQDDVLTSLARIGDLKVISRTSVMPYRGKPHNLREIAKELDVSALVEGSIRRSGNRIRLVA